MAKLLWDGTQAWAAANNLGLRNIEALSKAADNFTPQAEEKRLISQRNIEAMQGADEATRLQAQMAMANTSRPQGLTGGVATPFFGSELPPADAQTMGATPQGTAGAAGLGAQPPQQMGKIFSGEEALSGAGSVAQLAQAAVAPVQPTLRVRDDPDNPQNSLVSMPRTQLFKFFNTIDNDRRAIEEKATPLLEKYNQLDDMQKKASNPHAVMQFEKLKNEVERELAVLKANEREIVKNTGQHLAKVISSGDPEQIEAGLNAMGMQVQGMKPIPKEQGGGYAFFVPDPKNKGSFVPMKATGAQIAQFVGQFTKTEDSLGEHGGTVRTTTTAWGDKTVEGDQEAKARFEHSNSKLANERTKREVDKQNADATTMNAGTHRMNAENARNEVTAKKLTPEEKAQFTELQTRFDAAKSDTERAEIMREYTRLHNQVALRQDKVTPLAGAEGSVKLSEGEQKQEEAMHKSLAELNVEIATASKERNFFGGKSDYEKLIEKRDYVIANLPSTKIKKSKVLANLESDYKRYLQDGDSRTASIAIIQSMVHDGVLDPSSANAIPTIRLHLGNFGASPSDIQAAIDHAITMQSTKGKGTDLQLNETQGGSINKPAVGLIHGAQGLLQGIKGYNPSK